jgi:hypothetical protein
MIPPKSYRPTIPLAEGIPPTAVLLARLERHEAEGELLRRLLWLAHERDRQAERLAPTGPGPAGPTDAASTGNVVC